MICKTMKKYRINYYYHKRPKPRYALELIVAYGEMPTNLDREDASIILSALESFVKFFQYKIRNSINILGVTHNIERTDTRIMIRTRNDRPVLSFFIEEYETAGV